MTCTLPASIDPSPPAGLSAAGVALAWLEPGLIDGIDRPQFCERIGESLLIGGLALHAGNLVGRIRACDLTEGTAETVFEALVVPAAKLALWPRLDLELGFTAIAELAGGPGPRLCIALVALERSRLLLTDNGRTFQQRPNPPPELGLRRPLGSLAALQQRLYAAPAGALQGDPETAAAHCCVVSAEGWDQPWRRLSPAPLGEKGARLVEPMITGDGRLLAAVSNPLYGFQLFAADDPADPGNWSLLLGQGAERYSENACISALLADGDHLWLGAGGLGRGLRPGDRAVDAPPELLRLHSNGSEWAWELICGRPRFTPECLRVPLTATGPGCGEQRVAVLSHLVHWQQQVLVVGNGAPAADGSFRLWRVGGDGNTLSLLTDDGLGLEQHWLACLRVVDEALVGFAHPRSDATRASPARGFVLRLS